MRKNELSILHLTTSEEVFFKQQIGALREKGIDCTVLVVPGQEQIDGDMGKRRSIREYLRFFPQVRAELKRSDYDIVHANYGLTAPYAVLLSRLPVVLSLWGSDVVGFDGLVTRSFAWQCDAITVRSKEMQEMVGCPNAHILPSGIDLDKFYSVPKQQARDQVNWKNDGYHVLFPYSPEYERKQFPLAKSVVNGAKETIEAEITLHTLSGVPHDEMVYYINASDVLLLTSRHEGSPNTVKEALACDIPIVSTDVGDVNQRLTNVSPSGVGSGKSELIDKLVRVIQNGGRPNGRETVKDISWENMSSRIIEIYESVLDQKQSTTST